MRRTTQERLVLVFLVLLFISIAPSVEAEDYTAHGSAEEEAVIDAYVYTFPLVMMSTTMKNAINTIEPTPEKGPVNQLFHANHLANASFREVVGPNVDTLYSQAFIDLRDDPLVFVKPAADRFCSAQFMDCWSNTVAVAGSGGDSPAEDEQVWLLMREDDTTTVVPSGMKTARFPGDMGWIVGRTICKGDDDLEATRAIQEQMKLLPLEVYQSEEPWTPPKGTYDAQYDYVPVERVMGMTAQEFFDEANALMNSNPPVAADKSMQEPMKSVNVGPGMTFDTTLLGTDSASQEAVWKAVTEKAYQRAFASSQKFFFNWDPWQGYGFPIGEFGTEYDYRMLVARDGFGANPTSVAIYAKAEVDSGGEPLRAGGRYRIHFEADALPPVKKAEGGFWSITAYDDDFFLIDNPFNRYAINDRSPVVYNDDGSLDLLLQSDAPADDNPLRDNWLPIGNGGFQLVMRIYCPDMNEIDGGWEVPDIVNVQSEG